MANLERWSWRKRGRSDQSPQPMHQQAVFLVGQLFALPHVQDQLEKATTRDGIVPHFRYTLNIDTEQFEFDITTEWDGRTQDEVQLCVDGKWRFQPSQDTPQLDIPAELDDEQMESLNNMSGYFTRNLARFLEKSENKD